VRRTLIAIAAVALLLTAMVASSGPFALSWWTVDSGGGASTGGGFSLVGTIGQVETGNSSGGGFSLTGGFWPAVEARWEAFAPVIWR
jgi:hypothetical protein